MYRGFNEWLAAPWTVDPRGGEAAALGALIERYPYFELAQVLAVSVGTLHIDQVAWTFAGRPYPRLWLDPIEAPSNNTPQNNQKNSAAEPENEDLVAPYTVMGEEFASETLAAILAAQGKNNQAKAMYAKLCLKNPEKSSYFASLIEQL